MRVVRLTRPEAFQLPEIRRLFLAALYSGAKNPERSIDKIAARVGDPALAVFVGLEDGKPKAQLTVYLPGDPQTDWPTFDLGTNEGSLELSKAMIAAGVAFLRAAGYNQAWGFNFSGHSDKAYIRHGRRLGLKLRPRCTMMEIDF